MIKVFCLCYLPRQLYWRALLWLGPLNAHGPRHCGRLILEQLANVPLRNLIETSKNKKA